MQLHGLDLMVRVHFEAGSQYFLWYYQSNRGYVGKNEESSAERRIVRNERVRGSLIFSLQSVGYSQFGGRSRQLKLALNAAILGQITPQFTNDHPSCFNTSTAAAMSPPGTNI